MTTALGWRSCRSRVDDAGIDRLSRRMLEHDATAEETSAAAVTVQVVPPLPVTARLVRVATPVVATAGAEAEAEAEAEAVAETAADEEAAEV